MSLRKQDKNSTIHNSPAILYTPPPGLGPQTTLEHQEDNDLSQASAQLLSLLRTAPQEPITVEDPFAKFMTDREISRIHNIQLAQLVNDDPYSEDFYYQSYTQRCKAKKLLQATEGFTDPLYLPLPHHSYKIKTPRLPRPTDVVLAGALGKISLNSIRRPKQSIALDVNSKIETFSINTTMTSRLSHSKYIELLYNSLNSLVDIMSDHGPDDFRTHEERIQSSKSHQSNIESALYDESLILFTTKKGLKWIGKALSSEQTLIDMQSWFTDMLLPNIPSISRLLASHLEEQFITSVLGSLVPFLSSITFQTIISWINHPILDTLESTIFHLKSFYVLLCIILSRAEMLKASNDIDPSLLKSLSTRLHKEKLSGQYPLLFSSSNDATSHQEQYYAWQLVALLATNLDTVSCHEMVAELRNEIMICSNHSNPGMIANANLLLHVIGLDASQLRQ